MTKKEKKKTTNKMAKYNNMKIEITNKIIYIKTNKIAGDNY